MTSFKTISIVPVADAPTEDAQAQGCAEFEPFALRVVGDSMAPEFLDGHIVILDPGLRPKEGAYVVADVGGETYLRRYSERGHARLHALKQGIAPIELEQGYRLLGVVTQRAGRRRRDRKHYD